MTPQAGTAIELRVLVLAPIGRDAEVTCAVLTGSGLACHACSDVEELQREFATGAGAILLTAEALGSGDSSSLARLLRAQPPWSDIPVILAVAARRGTRDVREWAEDAFGRPGAVTVLERPIRLFTFQTILRAAIAARRRQYELRDVLEELRVNVERLDAEKVVRERFVSLLAHDLRGPLSAAAMAAKLILARPERLDERRDLAVRIERNVLRADRMIQDLLDANRLRAGQRLSLDLQVCDLAEIATDVVDDLSDDERRRVALNVPDRLEGVWAPDQLRRALWNLMTNALKYGSADGTVTMDVHREPDSVIISVHNTGPGIPSEDQPRLFEPFSRAVGAEGRARGWGLGLTLVRGFVDAHGGSLDLSSTSESGTTFTVRLPLDARPYQKAEERGAAEG